MSKPLPVSVCTIPIVGVQEASLLGRPVAAPDCLVTAGVDELGARGLPRGGHGKGRVGKGTGAVEALYKERGR